MIIAGKWAFYPRLGHKVRYLAPRAGDWAKLMVVFEHPCPKDFTTQVPLGRPIAERKCHFRSTCGQD